MWRPQTPPKPSTGLPPAPLSLSKGPGHESQTHLNFPQRQLWISQSPIRSNLHKHHVFETHHLLGIMVAEEQHELGATVLFVHSRTVSALLSGLLAVLNVERQPKSSKS